MRRSDIGDDERGALAGVPASSSSARSAEAETVIPFPLRQARAAALKGLAADDTPPVSSAPFESIGSLTLAVVMTLAGKRYPMKVFVPAVLEKGEEDGRNDD